VEGRNRGGPGPELLQKGGSPTRAKIEERERGWFFARGGEKMEKGLGDTMNVEQTWGGLRCGTRSRKIELCPEKEGGVTHLREPTKKAVNR